MTPAKAPEDLIVLVADRDIQLSIEEVLKRRHALEIREISVVVVSHPMRDPGVLLDADHFLQAQCKNYRHAVTICDRHGCGNEDLPREQLERSIESRLQNHWADRAMAIVIDPELENWLWADSPHIAKEIGWQGGRNELRVWLHNEGFLTEGRSKPSDPKAALEKALRETRQRRSSALYQILARKVSFKHCVDPAFLKLKETLRRWFPPRNEPPS